MTEDSIWVQKLQTQLGEDEKFRREQQRNVMSKFELMWNNNTKTLLASENSSSDLLTEEIKKVRQEIASLKEK